MGCELCAIIVTADMVKWPESQLQNTLSLYASLHYEFTLFHAWCHVMLYSSLFIFVNASLSSFSSTLVKVTVCNLLMVSGVFCIMLHYLQRHFMINEQNKFQHESEMKKLFGQ